MPETPETESRIAKIQKDVEELKEFMRDSIHDKPETYKTRVKNALTGYPACVTLFLEIDGVRSLNEIKAYLKAKGKGIPHATFYRAVDRLRRGLIYKTGVKNRSPIYSKKTWVKELFIDDYVREKFRVP
jgi:hypothetical protein